MTFTLKSGYSRKTIQENMAVMQRHGIGRVLAIRSAFDKARQSFFKAHPKGALPEWLAYPRDRRIAKYYLDSGAPMRDVRETNPVRELGISDEERDDIQRKVQKEFSGTGADVRRAAKLYADFTGHDDVQVTKVVIPDMPHAALAIGKVDGILYSTVRDGVAEKYIHRFKSSSRPLFLASPDGKQLYLIGGSYNFTELGIVDK